jgi:hypothetical protein
MIHQNAEWRLEVGSQSVDTTKLKFIKHLSLAVRAGFTPESRRERRVPSEPSHHIWVRLAPASASSFIRTIIGLRRPSRNSPSQTR